MAGLGEEEGDEDVVEGEEGADRDAMEFPAATEAEAEGHLTTAALGPPLFPSALAVRKR